MLRSIVWFRRDLSLEDNLAWADATQNSDEVVPLFVLDERLLAAAGRARQDALFGALGALDRDLHACGGALTVVRGDPAVEVARLARESEATSVYWNADVTRYAQARDRAVEQALGELHIDVHARWSTLVHPPGAVTTRAGTVPKVFTRFYERWTELESPPHACTGAAAVRADSRDELPQASGPRPPAETLEAFVDGVDSYHDTRDDLALDATSRLSAHLHFGAISPRVVIRAVGRHTKGRRAFVRQLAWRDWYAHLFWERPDLVDCAMQEVFDAIEWRNDPHEIERWKSGSTGVPIVDAAMRHLAASGWMPNRARMIVASFLVKDLLVDWRIGERHFRHLLADGDVPQNAGNWQWVAGTGPDAAPYFRVLNPVTQAQRFDPDGDYVRRWVPELAGIPGGAVHEPWELPPLELAAGGVVLGDTYPFPAVDHRNARIRALDAYAAARHTRGT
ncbi:MAG TPA: deoxyribodipyrimidine photo-lyase [Acidimicrobiia bacterium]